MIWPHTINDIGKDEPALLLQALNAMQGNLRNMVLHIKGASVLLVSSSEQLHSVISAATTGLQEQNRDIEQAATAVNEMTAAVDDGVRNNRQKSADRSPLLTGGYRPIAGCFIG